MYIIGAIILLTLLGLSVWGYISFSTYAPKEYVVENENGTSTKNTVTGELTPTVKTFTSREVAIHSTGTNCYSIISNSVYDLTAGVNVHPGGKDRIISICGIDGTDKFTGKHKGEKKFLDILSRFKIGVVL